MEALRTVLESYNIPTLKQIAKQIGLETTGIPKTGLVANLIQALVIQARSETTFQALSPVEKAVLALVLQKKGECDAHELLLLLFQAGLIQPDVEATAASPASPFLKEVLHRLAVQGLLFNFGPLQPDSVRRTLDSLERVGIPPEIQAVLPRTLLQLPESRSQRPSLPPPERVESSSAEAALRQLFLIWAELRRQPAKLLLSGGIGKRDLRRLAASLGLNLEQDEATLLTFFALLVAADLLIVSGDVITAADDQAGLRFWSTTLPEQVRQLVLVSQALETHVPVNLGPLTALGLYYYSDLTCRPLSTLHQQLLTRLQVLDDQWVSFTFFLSLLNQGRPGHFIFEPAQLQAVLQRYFAYSSRASKRSELDETLRSIEAQTVFTLLEPFKILGVIELGYGAATLPTQVRLTPLGHAALHQLPFTSPPAVGQVVLQPDFQILALGPVALSTLASLERIARREKVAANVIEYRLTRDSIYAALQAHTPLGSILAFLQQVTDQPLPQNVERTLEEWGDQYERIVLRRDVLVIQVAHPDLLTHLQQHPQLGPHLHPLDERTAWLPSTEMARLETILWEEQLLPSFSRNPEADLPKSLNWDNGHLHSRTPLPSLYVAGTVRRLATEGADGWEVTLPAIRAAIKTGLTVPEIVALIEKMIGEPLPTEWVKQIKAWGGHFGQGQAARALLLRLESKEALQELRRADGRLRRWLHPLPGAEAALAVAEEAHWDEIRTSLEEWGIPIVEQAWW